MSCTGPAAEARDLGTLRGFELRVASDEADDMAGNDRQGFVSRQGGFQCRHEPGAAARLLRTGPAQGIATIKVARPFRVDFSGTT